MSKKFIITSLFCITLALAIYSLVHTPRVIDVNNKNQITVYKMQDNNFSKKGSIQFIGKYFEENGEFKGDIKIDNRIYTNCLISSGSGVISYNDNQRIIFGQSYIGKDFTQLTMEINNGILYDQLSNGAPYSEDFIISIPSQDRTSALLLNKELKDDYIKKLEHR